MFRKVFAETLCWHSNNNFPLNDIVIVHSNRLFLHPNPFAFFFNPRMHQDDLWHYKYFDNNAGALPSTLGRNVQPWKPLWANFNEQKRNMGGK